MSPNDSNRRDSDLTPAARSPRPRAVLSGRRWTTGHTPPRLVTFSWGGVSVAPTRR